MMLYPPMRLWTTLYTPLPITVVTSGRICHVYDLFYYILLFIHHHRVVIKQFFSLSSRSVPLACKGVSALMGRHHWNILLFSHHAFPAPGHFLASQEVLIRSILRPRNHSPIFPYVCIWRSSRPVSLSAHVSIAYPVHWRFSIVSKCLGLKGSGYCWKPQVPIFYLASSIRTC